MIIKNCGTKRRLLSNGRKLVICDNANICDKKCFTGINKKAPHKKDYSCCKRAFCAIANITVECIDVKKLKA